MACIRHATDEEKDMIQLGDGNSCGISKQSKRIIQKIFQNTSY